jgi:hypothetical protein
MAEIVSSEGFALPGVMPLERGHTLGGGVMPVWPVLLAPPWVCGRRCPLRSVGPAPRPGTCATWLSRALARRGAPGARGSPTASALVRCCGGGGRAPQPGKRWRLVVKSPPSPPAGVPSLAPPGPAVGPRWPSRQGDGREQRHGGAAHGTARDGPQGAAAAPTHAGAERDVSQRVGGTRHACGPHDSPPRLPRNHGAMPHPAGASAGAAGAGPPTGRPPLSGPAPARRSRHTRPGLEVGDHGPLAGRPCGPHGRNGARAACPQGTTGAGDACNGAERRGGRAGRRPGCCRHAGARGGEAPCAGAATHRSPESRRPLRQRRGLRCPGPRCRALPRGPRGAGARGPPRPRATPAL